jgi:glycosyltransferase involved in cell wall biosynthesis
MSIDAAHGTTPGVTVITVVLNAAATLDRNLDSVAGQSWPALEHVVVDGGSTDGTLELLAARGPAVRVVGGPDRGLYDAMNKGVAHVTDPARYVMFLNADDTFTGPDAVERVMRGSHGEDLVYARLERWDEELHDRDVIGREVSERDLLFGMACHHQTMFARRALFDTVGGFDLAYRIAADYDWAVRVFRRDGVSRVFVPHVVSVMRRGGLSDKHYLASVRERWRIVRRHYGAFDLMLYSAYTGVGDYGRYWLQQALGRVGLLQQARNLKRALRGHVS